MRIHTDRLTDGELCYQLACVSPWLRLESTRHGSRKRNHAFEVSITYCGEKVKGDGRGRTNAGTSGYNFDRPYAATWDEWGEWLALLFELDPDMIAGPYDGRDDFYAQTAESVKWASRGKAKGNWLK